MKEVDPELLFLVIFHYGLDHGLLKLQKRFICLFFFQPFKKRTIHNFSELLNECMEKPYPAHLLSIEYNHHVYTRLFIPRTSQRSHYCGNRRHSSLLHVIC
jgi:hypothetical protein